MARKVMFSMDVTNNALLQANPREFYTKALLGRRSNSHMRNLLSIKEKTKIGNLEFGDILNEADCDFVVNGSTLDAKEMEPCKIALNVEVCQFEIEQSFLADWMKSGSNHADFMPADFASHYYEELERTVNDQLEVLTWQGDTDLDPDDLPEGKKYLALCDGLEKKLCGADIPTAQNIAGTAITPVNVIAQMTLVYNQIPVRVAANKDRVKWFISRNVYEAFMLAVASASAEVFVNRVPDSNFLGYELVVADGMSDNAMVLSREDNFIFLTDLISDPTDFITIDMKQTTGDRKIRTISDFKFGVDYLNDDEFVVYGLGCSAS
jgi:hypothetical protein